jgi:hypothetical protein
VPWQVVAGLYPRRHGFNPNQFVWGWGGNKQWGTFSPRVFLPCQICHRCPKAIHLSQTLHKPGYWHRAMKQTHTHTHTHTNTKLCIRKLNYCAFRAVAYFLDSLMVNGKDRSVHPSMQTVFKILITSVWKNVYICYITNVTLYQVALTHRILAIRGLNPSIRSTTAVPVTFFFQSLRSNTGKALQHNRPQPLVPMFFEVLNHVISGRHKSRDAFKAPLDIPHSKHFHVNTQAHIIVKEFPH